MIARGKWQWARNKIYAARKWGVVRVWERLSSRLQAANRQLTKNNTTCTTHVQSLQNTTYSTRWQSYLFPNLDFINIFVQVRILKMCATSSSSAGLTCQLSRSPDLDQERRAHCLLSCLLGRFFTLDLNWQRRTWQLPFAWLPRTLAGLFLLFGSLRWELRQLFARRHLEGISFLYRWSFFCNSISAYSCCQEPEMGQVKGCHNGEVFIDHVYPLDGRLIEKFLSSSFLDDNHASVDW